MFSPTKPTTVNQVISLDKVLADLQQVLKYNAEEAVRKAALINQLHGEISHHDAEGIKAEEVSRNLKTLIGVK